MLSFRVYVYSVFSPLHTQPNVVGQGLGVRVYALAVPPPAHLNKL